MAISRDELAAQLLRDISRERTPVGRDAWLKVCQEAITRADEFIKALGKPEPKAEPKAEPKLDARTVARVVALRAMWSERILREICSDAPTDARRVITDLITVLYGDQ